MESSKLRKAAFLSLCTLALLAVGALVFWKERMLLCDAPHIAFRIINDQKLQIQELRYGAFITQSVPLIASKLHLPLKTVLILYSLSFNLFYFLVGVILFFRFKAYSLVILMGFYYTLFVADTYYWTNNELHQGVAWMFLCFGYIFSPVRRPHFVWAAAVLVVIGGLAIISHPLVTAPFAFLWVFLWLSRTLWPFNMLQSIILTAIVAALVVGKILLSKLTGSYDTALMTGISEISLKTVADTFTSNMAKQLWENGIHSFLLVPALAVIGLAFLIKEGKYLLAVYTIFFCVAFFVAICLTFPGYLSFYTESELMPAAVLAAVPFVYFVLPRLRQWQVLVIVAVIFLSRLNAIHRSSQHFTNRVKAIDSILQQMKREGIERLALLKDDISVEWTWMLDWGIPDESIMLSAMSDDTVVRQFIFINPGEGARIAVRLDQFVTIEVWNYSQINKFYFNFGAPQLYVVKPYKEYMDKVRAR